MADDDDMQRISRFTANIKCGRLKHHRDQQTCRDAVRLIPQALTCYEKSTTCQNAVRLTLSALRMLCYNDRIEREQVYTVSMERLTREH